MGGRTFLLPKPETGEAGLNTPRLLPETYFALKDRVCKTLAAYFEEVNVASEAPEKADYGDIDFQVWGFRSTIQDEVVGDSQQVCQLLHQKLEATRSLYHPSVDTMSFAMKLPAGMAVRNSQGPTVSPYDSTPHFQVDVVVCKDRALYDYQRVLHAHGDWRDTLAVALHPLGLVFFPNGLAVRVEEIRNAPIADAEHKCRVHLSADPVHIFMFLGLDLVALQQGFVFKTMDELFWWMVQSRFFARKPYEDRIASASPQASSVGSSASRSSTSARDETWYRDKMLKKRRSMFEYFVLEWLPSRPTVGQRETPARNDIMNEALAFFSQQEEHARIMARYSKEMSERQLWEDITEFVQQQVVIDIPDDYLPVNHQPIQPKPNVTKIRGDKVRRALRALRRYVGFDSSTVRPVSARQACNAVALNTPSSLGSTATQCASPTRNKRVPVVLSDRENSVGTGEMFSWVEASDCSPAELLQWVKQNWRTMVEMERQKERDTAEKKRMEKEARKAREAPTAADGVGVGQSEKIVMISREG